MAQCRPINFFREPVVLNYDLASGKGFVTEKSLKQSISCLIRLFILTIESILKFNNAKKNFKNRVIEVTNKEFWTEYLGMKKL